MATNKTESNTMADEHNFAEDAAAHAKAGRDELGGFRAEVLGRLNVLEAKFNRVLAVALAIAEFQVKQNAGLSAALGKEVKTGIIGGIHPSQLSSHGAPTDAGEAWTPDKLAGGYGFRR